MMVFYIAQKLFDAKTKTHAVTYTIRCSVPNFISRCKVTVNHGAIIRLINSKNHVANTSGLALKNFIHEI